MYGQLQLKLSKLQKPENSRINRTEQTVVVYTKTNRTHNKAFFQEICQDRLTSRQNPSAQQIFQTTLTGEQLKKRLLRNAKCIAKSQEHFFKIQLHQAMTYRERQDSVKLINELKVKCKESGIFKSLH